MIQLRKIHIELQRSIECVCVCVRGSDCMKMLSFALHSFMRSTLISVIALHSAQEIR